MSDQADFDAEFANMLASEGAVEAPAKKTRAKREPKPAAAKVARAKHEPVPNAYGIVQKKSGQVITDTYLARYVYCSSRDLTYNRAENLKFFLSPEFLETMRGVDTGVLCQAISYSSRWNDPAKPAEWRVKPAKREAKPKAEKKPRGKKAQANAETAANIEAEILGEAPLY